MPSLQLEPSLQTLPVQHEYPAIPHRRHMLVPPHTRLGPLQPSTQQPAPGVRPQLVAHTPDGDVPMQ